MLTRLIRGFAASVLIVLGTQQAAAGPSDVDPAALAVAESYFSALQSGDLQAMLALLGGGDYSRSEAQLSDPDYASFLTERYSGARLEVMDGGVRNGVEYVDIRIWINDAEYVGERLVLKPSGDTADGGLQIVARQELE